ncbi:MAG: MBL fold metallo-hydrolase [Erysipelotrichaceae bacterium]|nr:MBL fold metallo-hydrolase [Erysipelotrichaceae bacterium]
MPGNLKNTTPNRYIKSDLKSHKIIWEEEHPCRWPYMKILREYSTLKEFYPEIDPYVEAYKMRDNMWAIFQESMDGVGDVWMYLIDGPEKAMLIDTGFGVGDLKSLVEKLVGKKELIIANTHHHFDHAYGNSQFAKVYCYEREVPQLIKTVDPHIWDYLYDPVTRKGIYTEFDPDDIIPFAPAEIIGVEANHIFDLGDGYEVELIPLTGHTAGMSGYLDRHNRTLIIGDITGVGLPKEGEPHPENCTVEALRDCFEAIWKRHDEYDGVFPGHGALDQTNTMIRYHLYATEQILKDPENCDERSEIVRPSGTSIICKKYVQQGTAIRYNLNNVYKKDMNG